MNRSVLYCCFLFIVIGSSCKNKSRRIFNRPVISQQKAAEASIPEIPARDYSITKENAYNDIFLDSLAADRFIQENITEDSIRENFLDFYNVRNFEFAWFDSNGLTEQALGFRSLFKYSTDSLNRQLDRKLDNFLQKEGVIDPKDSSVIAVELQLTQRFVKFALAKFQEPDMSNRHFETFIPIKKQSVLSLADSVLSEKNADNTRYASTNPYYDSLKVQLKKYMAIYQQGSWPLIPEITTKLTAGNEYPQITVIKNRLALSGELAENDSTALFTAALKNAVKQYQSEQGISADGKISPLLVKKLNVPVLTRIQQLLINMERMRWMPVKKAGKLILVNIPEFMLHVSDSETHVLHMPVVVGKEGHNTTMFSDDLTTIVFSPYWNVPPSIVKNEILPAMQKNKKYLEQNHMEITRAGSLPDIRQLPGKWNSLGRVKFLFPNSFNIYFHDTPAKSLFDNDYRAASHGCIRLSDPVKMANYLLENAPEWTPEKIEEAMNQDKEKWVVLKHSIPVIITYYTAWVDEKGRLNFRDDVYKNDAVFASKMFIQSDK